MISCVVFTALMLCSKRQSSTRSAWLKLRNSLILRKNNFWMETSLHLAATWAVVSVQMDFHLIMSQIAEITPFRFWLKHCSSSATTSVFFWQCLRTKILAVFVRDLFVIKVITGLLSEKLQMSGITLTLLILFHQAHSTSVISSWTLS